MNKRIGIVVPPYLGHIFPTLGVGRELLQLGYEVYWMCHLDYIESMIPDGGKFIFIGKEKAGQEGRNSSNSHGIQSLKNLYEDTLIPLNEQLYTQLSTAHNQYGFDFIISDHQTFSTPLFAVLNNIPYCMSITAPATLEESEHFPEVNRYEREVVEAFQQRIGSFDSEALSYNAPINLVYSSRELLDSQLDGNRYHFVGPSIENRTEWPIDLSRIESNIGSRPVILVSLGSLLKREERFLDLLIDAFSEEDICVVLVGEKNVRSHWPSNFEVHSYIPQLQVLALVDAVICHAGHNTVCEALSFGLPLITLPVAFDQSFVASKVAACGAGIRLKYKRVKASVLRESLRSILTDERYRNAATEVQESFARAGGSKVAADIVHQAVLDDVGRKSLELHCA